MKFHITKYTANEKKYASSWVQIDVFRKQICLHQRIIEL